LQNKVYNIVKQVQTRITIYYNSNYCFLDFKDCIYIKIIKIREVDYYLLIKSTSLSTKKIELFKIIRKINNLVYKLKLSKYIKIYNIIFVIYLKQVSLNALFRDILLLSLIKHKDNKLYIIKYIIYREIKNKKLKYIIK